MTVMFSSPAAPSPRDVEFIEPTDISWLVHDFNYCSLKYRLDIVSAIKSYEKLRRQMCLPF